MNGNVFSPHDPVNLTALAVKMGFDDFKLAGRQKQIENKTGGGDQYQ
jgi:hypothetical protein